MTEWELQDAKNRFGALVDAALAGEPQHVSQHGRPTVVVLSVAEYERLRRPERTDAPTFGELLLEIPQDDLEYDRMPLTARPVAPPSSPPMETFC